ncbi:MAG: putative ABC exporter domain-containing protein [Gemmatimonadaceae bacterium]
MGAVGALVYLTWTSLRNRVAFQLRRSRNPRYALALVIGVAYFWFVFGRHAGGARGRSPLDLGGAAHLVVVGALFAGAAAVWLFGGDRTALAFSQAEAMFLFPAPLSRRQLVGYKLWRAQFVVIVNTLLWMLILRQNGSTLPFVLRATGLWLLFTVGYLHRLGAALVRESWAQHGMPGARRHALSIVVFVAAIGAVTFNVVASAGAWRAADGAGAAATALSAALARQPASLVLWPINAILAPASAGSATEWLHVLPGALLVLLVHVVWVMRTDTAFEEAALAATSERARRLAALRSRGALATAKPSAAARPGAAAASARGFPLAPTGRPAVAIVWKNIACLRRTTQFRQLFSPMLLAAVVGTLAGPKLGGVAAGLALGALVLTAVLLLMGPMMLRGDLRQDLLHLAELKTLPFRGATIVAAEVLSVSIPLAVVQALALAAAAGAAHVAHLEWAPPPMRWAVAVGGLPVLLAFNAASVTIQNGAPILFPGWARLGTVVAGGVEMMGQMILLMGFYLMQLAALLVVPAAIGFVSVYELGATGAAGLLVALLAGSAALAFELQGVMQLLGRAFERIEPTSISG